MISSSDKETKRSYSKRKHMRLPNGFGQITKLKGNLRNPYRAMVTVGKTPAELRYWRHEKYRKLLVVSETVNRKEDLNQYRSSVPGNITLA